MPTTLALDAPASARPTRTKEWQFSWETTPAPLVPAPGTCLGSAIPYYRHKTCLWHVRPSRICEACYYEAAVLLALAFETELEYCFDLSCGSPKLREAMESAAHRRTTEWYQDHSPLRFHLSLAEARKLQYLTDTFCVMMARDDFSAVQKLRGVYAGPVDLPRIQCGVVLLPDETSKSHPLTRRSLRRTRLMFAFALAAIIAVALINFGANRLHLNTGAEPEDTPASWDASGR